MAPGTVLIGFLTPLTDTEGIERLRRQGVIAFAMESVPRITRAQSMDALSSQATVAGHKAVRLRTFEDVVVGLLRLRVDVVEHRTAAQ